MVEALASYVTNKAYDPEYAIIHKEAKARWLAADAAEVMWWPRAAHRLAKSAPREWEDARRVKVALPRADFYAELAALKASRVAHRTAQVRAAQTIVENARQAAAAAPVTWGEPGAKWGEPGAKWGEPGAKWGGDGATFGMGGK